jgi:DNA-3-methyladenine glycosylase
MFGRPGRAYVYKCHMYPLLNVVTEKPGIPGAVLLRGIEPAAGIELMKGNRPNAGKPHELANGPGKLGLAFGIRLSHNTADLVKGRLFLARPARRRPARILRSTRIGLRGPASRLPWRFYVPDNPCVSIHPDIRKAR